MEGFTIGLALVDAVPVLSFGISMVIIATRFRSPLFMIGAALSVLAGCCKVAWKLVLGVAKKDLRWLNKPFVPMQATGFLLMLISFILGFASINWAGTGAALISFPSILFFAAWIGLIPTGPPRSSTRWAKPVCCWVSSSPVNKQNNGLPNWQAVHRSASAFP